MVMGCNMRTFGLSGLIRPGWYRRAGLFGFFSSTIRVCEQGPPLAEASSLSCVDKSSLNFSPPALRRGLHRRAGKFPGRGRRWLTRDGCAGN